MRRTALAAAAGVVLAAVPAAAGAQGWKEVSLAHQRIGEETLDVRVAYGAGTLRVGPDAGGLLYRFDLRYDDDRFRPVNELDRATGRLRLGVESRDRRENRDVREGSRATIGLNPEVPLDLELQFGAGEAKVDLGGLSLRSLTLSTGASETEVAFARPNRVAAGTVSLASGAAALRASGLGNARASAYEFKGGVGETTLDFGGVWDRDATATVDMGVGSVRLVFPRGLGVRIVKESFLASFDAPGMVKRGNAWFSRDWDSAPHKLTVSIDAAFGAISVDWTG